MTFRELKRNRSLEVRSNNGFHVNSEEAFAYSMKYRNQFTFRNPRITKRTEYKVG